jgi:hypothetical protein
VKQKRFNVEQIVAVLKQAPRRALGREHDGDRPLGRQGLGRDVSLSAYLHRHLRAGLRERRSGPKP